MQPIHCSLRLNTTQWRDRNEQRSPSPSDPQQFFIIHPNKATVRKSWGAKRKTTFAGDIFDILAWTPWSSVRCEIALQILTIKKKEKANLCLHPCLWDLVCMSPRLRQGVPLGWNPRKRLSLYCLEDMLWKALALSDWWQWELSVWGPHSWLSKLNVVSRCTRGCTSLPRPSSVRWRNTVPLRASLRRPGEHVAVDSADLVSFFDCYTGGGDKLGMHLSDP